VTANATAAEQKLAAAHAALRATRGLQLEFAAVPPPPKPPGWLKALADALGVLAPIVPYLFWGGVAALAAVLLWMLIRDLEPIRRRRKKAELPAAWRPEPAAARALLDEADALAAAGQYAEAIHLLLFRSIEDLSQRRAGSAPPAFTSREIVETVEMPGPARGAFARIAAAVELSFFGGRPAGADDFQTCRRDYEAFAFAEGWR